jgi:glycosyltransferase involved in cell wall biosynthesis
MVTVLTDKIEGKAQFILEKNRVLQKTIKDLGHKSVTNSLLSGLDLNSIKYNFNIHTFDQLYENVIVLSGVNVLKQLISFKKRKKFNLYVGPNMVVVPDEYDEILSNDSIDKCIVPSEWIKNKYFERSIKLENKIVVWPAGVNELFWDDKNNSKDFILFYIKNVPYETYNQYLSYLINKNEKIKIIFYGQYDPIQYKTLLSKSKFLIHFGTTESQGLSQLEAWSMNVPTFVFNINFFQYSNDIYKASSSPYLTDQTGRFFNNLLEFKHIIENDLEIYSPRKWVLNNLTEKKASLNLLNLLNII